jgi:hypothetical protein
VVSMTTGGNKKAESYQLEPGFERGVCAMLAQSPRFYARIGAEIDTAAIDVPAHRMLAEAARSIARDTGTPPSSGLITLQRLRRWQHEGKITHEQVLACADALDAAESAGLPDEDAAVAEIAPVLQRRLRTEVVRDAMQEFAQRGDMVNVAEKIERARRIGIVTSSDTVTMGVHSFAAIRELRYMERLSFGVFELDAKTDGGLWRGALGVAISGFGGGKSMLLSQLAATSFVSGLFVGVVTLELAKALVLARIKGNITGVPTNLIISGEGEDLAMDRLEDLVVGQGCAGRLAVTYMTGGATTATDIAQWVKDEEHKAGRPMDVLIVDYADEMASTDPKDKGPYEAMKTVYRGLEAIAKNEKEQRPRWVWTASQAKRADRGRKKITGDDIADSINKMRVVDMAVTINLSEDQNEVDFFIAKNRLGRGGATTGPLPVELECGRIAPVTHVR